MDQKELVDMIVEYAKADRLDAVIGTDKVTGQQVTTLCLVNSKGFRRPVAKLFLEPAAANAEVAPPEGFYVVPNTLH